MFSQRTGWNTSPNRLTRALARRRASGAPVIDLTESNPTRCGFQFDQRMIAAALAEGAAAPYAPDPLGLLSAREAVADYYAESGVSISPAQIVLTTGSSEAYSFAFRLLADPGDEVLVPSPSYPLFDFLADINDVKAMRYPLGNEYGADLGWWIDLEELEARMTRRTRAVVTVSPNNPTGCYVRQAEQDLLVQLALRRRMALIADEVFRDFAWSGDVASAGGPGLAGSTGRAESVAGVTDCLTCTLNGLSKLCALPQMKLGWMVVNGPEELVRPALERLEVLADTYLPVGTAVQHAAPVLLAQRPAIQQELLERIRANLEHLDQCAEGSACSRLPAEGGWYAVLRVPETLDDEEWAVRLMEEEGVYVHPGHLFHFSGGAYLVLSLIAGQESFAQGVGRLLRMVAAG